MHRQRRLFVLLLGAAVAGLALSGVPEALANARLFHVHSIEVDGALHLGPDEVRRIAALPPGTTVWSDTEPVAERIGSHPLVRDVRVRRRIPSTLRIEISEREPVGLVAAPVLTPVDGEGRPLPLDPARLRLDLPILAAGPEPEEEEADTGGAVRLALRVLAAEAVRIEELDPGFGARVSELRHQEGVGVILRLADPPVDFLYDPPLRPARLREGLLVLRDALDRHGAEALFAVDLRFADQVVVRFTQGTGR